VLVDKGCLAVEQVDLAAGHLTVHQQQQAFALHRFQRGVDLADIGHPVVTVGGGAGRVELAGHHTGGLGTHDLFGSELVRQVQGHQRLEPQALGDGRQDARLVGQRQLGGRDRGFEVGHDDGTGKLPRRMGHRGGQGCVIAQMDVPVVGSEDADGGGCGAHPAIVAPVMRASSL